MMVSLGFRHSIFFKMLIDFKRFFDSKMHKRNIFILFICLRLASCGQRESATGFAEVCREKNNTSVQIRGFLTTTPNLTSNQNLLVENKNGTGGFIKLLLDQREQINPTGEVKITGKVLKDENGCVLKVEKIEE